MNPFKHTYTFVGPLPKTQPLRGHHMVQANYVRKIREIVWHKVLEDGVYPTDENGKKRPLRK